MLSFIDGMLGYIVFSYRNHRLSCKYKSIKILKNIKKLKFVKNELAVVFAQFVSFFLCIKLLSRSNLKVKFYVKNLKFA